MLDARFSHLYFCQRLHTLQRGLAAIADLLVYYAQKVFKRNTDFLVILLLNFHYNSIHTTSVTG